MKIENDYYLIEIEREHGRLVRLRDKVGKIELITEPRLAENFRLLLPVPGMHANYILGTEQPLTSSEVNANSATLVWTGPMVNERRPIRVGGDALDRTGRSGGALPLRGEEQHAASSSRRSGTG